MRSVRLLPLAALLSLSACAGPQAAGPEPSAPEERAQPAAEERGAAEQPGAGESGAGEAAAQAAREGAAEAAEAGAVAGEGTGETVRLDFAWPKEAEIPVALEVERVREGPGGRKVERARMAYVLDVDPAEQGLTVASRDVEVLEAIGSEADLTALMAQIPTLLVAEDGEVLEVRGASATVDAALAAADVPEALAGQLRAQLTTALEAGAVDWWNGLVGLWAGGELEIGRTYTEAIEEALPVLGVPVEVMVSYRVEGRVPCEEDGPPEGCVALRVVSSPEEAVVADALRAWTEGTADLPQEAAPDIVGLTSRAEVVVVSEPETLRPHHLERVRVIEVVFRGPAGGDHTQKGINRSEYRFE